MTHQSLLISLKKKPAAVLNESATGPQAPHALGFLTHHPSLRFVIPVSESMLLTIQRTQRRFLCVIHTVLDRA